MAYMDDIIDHIKQLERKIDKLERYGVGKYFVPPEVPTGAINSSNTVYTTASNFVTGSTMVYLQGTLQILGTDYTETDTNEITFTTAPTTGDSLVVAYKKD